MAVNPRPQRESNVIATCCRVANADAPDSKSVPQGVGFNPPSVLPQAVAILSTPIIRRDSGVHGRHWCVLILSIGPHRIAIESLAVHVGVHAPEGPFPSCRSPSSLSDPGRIPRGRQAIDAGLEVRPAPVGVEIHREADVPSAGCGNWATPGDGPRSRERGDERPRSAWKRRQRPSSSRRGSRRPRGRPGASRRRDGWRPRAREQGRPRRSRIQCGPSRPRRVHRQDVPPAALESAGSSAMVAALARSKTGSHAGSSEALRPLGGQDVQPGRRSPSSPHTTGDSPGRPTTGRSPPRRATGGAGGGRPRVEPRQGA